MADPRKDFHPDPFYRANSSTKGEAACHRGLGDAGWLGAAGTDCDTPVSLINATFRWIDAHLKESIDFVVWTGDSARHDNDVEIPRTEEQVTGLNELLVRKFVEVFGKEDHINDTDPTNDFVIPIIPNFGNNDILPHNILSKGPNRWTKRYTSIWNRFIPEEQRHGFERGGWFYVEVIPNQLAVFSLNTLYFFDSNSAVDGCADRSEPGYEQMEWLRVQLQFLRKRGMKAIITGHVPPARTDTKQSWDETCWQKYALWMRQYRDIVVGSMYGHMNLDHFVLQDSDDIDSVAMDDSTHAANMRAAFDDEFTIQSSAEYLKELRSEWSDLPNPPSVKAFWTSDKSILSPAEAQLEEDLSITRKHRRKHRKYLKEIGGEWAERYSASFVSPSVIPKYFPTIRVIHYNITGLEESPVTLSQSADNNSQSPEVIDLIDAESDDFTTNVIGNTQGAMPKHEPELDESKKKHKRPKKPRFKVPNPPPKTSPPGPAYSPQPLTWIGYTQYYLNLTRLYTEHTCPAPLSDDASPTTDLLPASPTTATKLEAAKPENPVKQVEFEVEYDTRDDSIYQLKDLTIRSLLDLATRIGQYKQRGDPTKLEQLEDLMYYVAARIQEDRPATMALTTVERQVAIELLQPANSRAEQTRLFTAPKNERPKETKGKRRRHIKMHEEWLTFLGRAFVGTLPEDDLYNEFCQDDGVGSGESEE